MYMFALIKMAFNLNLFKFVTAQSLKLAKSQQMETRNDANVNANNYQHLYGSSVTIVST